MLPNEILIMIVCNIPWSEDINDLVFSWTRLRLVSVMFKETVEKSFAARNIWSDRSELSALMKLLPKANIGKDIYGKLFLKLRDLLLTSDVRN